MDGLTVWQNLPIPGDYNDMSYRKWLLDCMMVEETCTDIDCALVRKADSIFSSFGSLFADPLEKLKNSSSFAPYLLLYGESPSNADVFTMLLSYDLFPFFAKCMNEASSSGSISSATLNALSEQCAL